MVKDLHESEARWFAQADPNRSLDSYVARTAIYKLLIHLEARRSILRELHRMNTSESTLFPGLDGFARSLGTTITMSEVDYLEECEVDERI